MVGAEFQSSAASRLSCKNRSQITPVPWITLCASIYGMKYLVVNINYLSKQHYSCMEIKTKIILLMLKIGNSYRKCWPVSSWKCFGLRCVMTCNSPVCQIMPVACLYNKCTTFLLHLPTLFMYSPQEQWEEAELHFQYREHLFIQWRLASECWWTECP